MNLEFLVTDPIDPAGLLREVASDEHGATSLFVGAVRSHNDGRDVTGVEYSAYAPMAEAELGRILGETRERYPGVRITLRHRLGALAVGEVSVGIACAHAHRAAAIEACHHVIEELKRRVPIWKREAYVDGTREWVDPTRPVSEART